MEKVYTINEVMEGLKVKPFIVRDWIDRGLLPAVKIGKTYRVPASVIEAAYRHGLPMEAK